MAEEDHNPFAAGAYDGADGDAYGGDAYGGSSVGGGDSGGGMPPPPPASAMATAMADAYSSADPETQAYVNDAAKEAATQVVTDAYAETAADFEQANASADGSNTTMPEPPGYWTRFANWFPLRWVAAFGGLIFAAFPILDFLFTPNITFSIAMLMIFVVLWGLLIIFIELPSFAATRPVQLKVFFWVKILSRTWGRGWFYLLLVLICFSTFESTEEFTFTGFAGVYMLLVVLITFIASRTAASKYVRIYDFVAAGKEGDLRDQLLEAKFKELDVSEAGSIGGIEIESLAGQAGRTLARCELHAICSFLDESCNGRISQHDFVFMFKNYNTRQKFL